MATNTTTRNPKMRELPPLTQIGTFTRTTDRLSSDIDHGETATIIQWENNDQQTVSIELTPTGNPNTETRTGAFNVYTNGRHTGTFDYRLLAVEHARKQLTTLKTEFY